MTPLCPGVAWRGHAVSFLPDLPVLENSWKEAHMRNLVAREVPGTPALCSLAWPTTGQRCPLERWVTVTCGAAWQCLGSAHFRLKTGSREAHSPKRWTCCRVGNSHIRPTRCSVRSSEGAWEGVWSGGPGDRPPHSRLLSCPRPEPDQRTGDTGVTCWPSVLLTGCYVTFYPREPHPASFQRPFRISRERASHRRFSFTNYTLVRVCREHVTVRRESQNYST